MPTQRLVVRSYTPLRRALLIGGSLVLAALGLFISFEWGRSTAGFDARGARAEAGDLQGRIRELQRDNREQRLQLAAVETQRVGQAREREELARTIGSLQADVARLTRDLAFYRGVVGETANAPVVRVQQLRIVQGATAEEYVLHLVLGRPLRPEDTVSGKARLTIEGASGTTPVSLDLTQVSGIASGELSFSYRYLQPLEQPVKLPAGFTAQRVTVELDVARKGVSPVRESFLWTVENG